MAEPREMVDMVARRSKLLANVVLTRRLNVEVHPFESIDGSPDLICTIRPEPHEKISGFLPFGVFVWGTSNELATEQDATKFARPKPAKFRKDTFTFLMPVIVLLFSMKKDEAYCAWVMEPCKDATKLIHWTSLDFTLFDVKHLDSLIFRIKKWYERMQTTILANPDEMELSAIRHAD
jgi:hypothetical protein